MTKKKTINKNVFLMVIMMMMLMMMNCFIVWLIEERRLALFPAGSIVTIANLRHATSTV